MIFGCRFLVAEVFLPQNFVLDGHIPFTNNRPDFNMQSRGISTDDDLLLMLNLMVTTIQYEVDVENQMIIVYIKNGNILLTDPLYISFDQYLDNIFAATFEKELEKARLRSFADRSVTQQTGLIPDIVIKLPPIAMPRAVRRIMGNQAGRLSLTGSQRVTISASRSYRDSNAISEYENKANFDIIMRQDLNMNLRGTIGEKITVSMKYNSNQETAMFDPNNIHIAYTGDEDEIVQSIEAGNTSLTLSGSRYISVSASSQGLFGIKANFKLGDLTLTTIMSKEEAQKNTRTFRGSGTASAQTVFGRNFAKRQRFYVVDPRDLFDLYTESDEVPWGWWDNAIKTDQFGSLKIRNSMILPADNSLKVFLDDNDGTNQIGKKEGWFIGEDRVEINRHHFRQLTPEEDYFIDYTTGIITFPRIVPHLHTIAVAYVERSGMVIGNYDMDPDGDPLSLKPIKRRNQTPQNNDTWTLELRNVYDLGMRNVRQDGFLLETFSYEPSGERDIFLPEELQTHGLLTVNDFLRLDTNGDGLINGDDATINLSSGLVVLPFINPFHGLGDEHQYIAENATDLNSRYNFYIEGQIGRDQIDLRQMMILPGSVSVRVNGREMVENVDYRVDYDFGIVTFLTAEGRDPSADIVINYENRPMFAVESKTLMGVRADWRPVDFFRLGGTFIYQSEKITDKRPKIGNESRALILANIDGEVSTEPGFITRGVNYIPFVKTEARSRVSLSGEVAINAPIIYGSDVFGDGNEAWIDDMESIADSYPLGITRASWSPASEPFGANLIKGRNNWFNPNNVYNRDVYHPSTLSEKQMWEKVSVLDLKIIPPPVYSPGISTPIWGGLMKYIGNQVDFSEREYIEFLVKVDSLDTSRNNIKFYLDLGDVSEDFYTEFGGRGRLDTEDGKNGGIVNGRLDWMEDVGFSGGLDPWEFFSNTEVNGEFPFINGRIGNGVLDTEDLNGNGMLDTVERLFRYEVSLSDTTSVYFQSQFNGWRLFRIPLRESEARSIHKNVSSDPDLSKISFVRMWYETPAMAKIRLVYLDIVGNKWRKMTIKERGADFIDTNVPQSTLEANDSYLSIGTIDNQKSNRYVSPPKTTEKGRDGEVSFEQAMMVTYNNISAEHFSLVNQRFFTPLNLLSYNKLRYWVYIEGGADAMWNPDFLNIVFRVGADSTNYYEVIKPLPVNDFARTMNISNWVEVEIDYTDLTRLKAISPDGNFSETHDGTTYTIRNRPTLSNIREIAIGIQVPPDVNPFTGIVYFNDIRVVDPNQNIGYAARATFDTRFADFSTVRVDYEVRSADFYTSTSRQMAASTSLEDRVTLSLSNNYSLDKFFPSTWGLRIPLNLSQNQSEGIPKYKANSDIVRSNLSADEQEREKNKSMARSAETSFAMNRNPNNKIALYTIRNLNLGAQVRETQTMSATRADTLLTWRYNGSYNLNIPVENIRLKLWSNYHWYYFPKMFNNSATYRGESPRRWDWSTIAATDSTAAESGWRPRPRSTQTVRTEVMDTSNEIRYDIFTDMDATYRLTTRRDMMSPVYWQSINVGQETERRQDISTRYTPFYMTSFANTQINASVNYSENRKQNRAPGTTIADEDFIYTYDGNMSRSIRTSTTLKNSDFFAFVANKLGTASNKRYDANVRESGQGFSNIDNLGSSDKGDDLGMDGNFDSGNFDLKEGDDISRGRGEDRGSRRDSDRTEDKDQEKDKESEDKKDEKPTKAPVEMTSLMADFFGFLAKIQNFNIGYDNTYGSRYTHRADRPEFLYQLGLPHIINHDELDSRTNNDSYSLSTGFPIIRNLVCDTRYAYQISRNYQHGNRGSKSTTQVWPDVRLSLGGFERLIKAEKFLSSSRVQTSYNFTERLNYDGNDWNKPIGNALTHTMSPLFGWQGNWVNRMTSSFTINHTQSTTNSFHSGSTTTRESTRTTFSGTWGYSFTAEQGILFPIINKRVFFTNQMTADVTGSYETEMRTSQSGHTPKQVEMDIDKISISPRVMYNFSRNIKGGLTSAYDVTTDNQSRVKINIFRMDLWMELMF
jgi:hypothetical protein